MSAQRADINSYGQRTYNRNGAYFETIDHLGLSHVCSMLMAAIALLPIFITQSRGAFFNEDIVQKVPIIRIYFRKGRDQQQA